MHTDNQYKFYKIAFGYWKVNYYYSIEKKIYQFTVHN